MRLQNLYDGIYLYVLVKRTTNDCVAANMTDAERRHDFRRKGGSSKTYSHLECEDGTLPVNVTNQPTNRLTDWMTNSTEQSL